MTMKKLLTIILIFIVTVGSFFVVSQVLAQDSEEVEEVETATDKPDEELIRQNVEERIQKVLNIIGS